jgi:hypothetical protein
MELNPASSALPPTRAPRHPADFDLSVGFRWSVAFHVALVFLVITKNLVFPGESIPYVPTLRVDIVGLPDILKKDLNKVPKMMDPSKLSDALKRAENEANSVKKTVVHKAEVERAMPEELGASRLDRPSELLGSGADFHRRSWPTRTVQFHETLRKRPV